MNDPYWACTACGASGDRGHYGHSRRCPSCGKAKVETAVCSSGMLCNLVGGLASRHGVGIHDNPEQARACERRRS
jgi:hypothetical protein